jgi:hypothetical protein
MKGRLVSCAALVVLCLSVVASAEAGRPPGPSERRGILATMRTVRDQVATDVNDSSLGPFRVTHIRISKLNSAYAWADVQSPHLETLGYLLRRVDGIWIPIGSGSDEMFPCNNAPPGIVREWLGGSYAHQICKTLGYHNEPSATVELRNWQKPVRRPLHLFLSRDHALALRDIIWKNWGSTTTRATATLVETAADGEHTAAVRVYLGERDRFGNGTVSYGSLLWTYVGESLADYPEPLHILALGQKPSLAP